MTIELPQPGDIWQWQHSRISTYLVTEIRHTKFNQHLYLFSAIRLECGEYIEILEYNGYDVDNARWKKLA